VIPQERKLKFDYDPADTARIKRRLGLMSVKNKAATQTSTSVYFDTPDLALYQSGVALHVQRVGERYIQAIEPVRPQNSGQSDLSEWQHPVEGPDADLVAAKGTAFEALLDGHLTQPLRRAFEVRRRRSTYRIGHRGLRMEIALDEGDVDSGERRIPLCQVELTLLRGEANDLYRAAREVGASARLRLGVKTQVDRGYELIRNELNAVEAAGDVELIPTMSSADAFRNIGHSCLRQLIANEPAMLAGNGEALHQMRVALRRLRAAISAFAEVVNDENCERIKGELKWISGKLGFSRDLDIFVVEVLDPMRRQNPDDRGLAGIYEEFVKRRAAAYRDAVETIRSVRFRGLLLDAAEWIDLGPWTTSYDESQMLRRERPIVQHASQELSRRRKKLKKAATSLRDLNASERHELRIRTKKHRYAMEFFGKVFTGGKSDKRRKATLASLKAVQDALGGLNDIATREGLASEIGLSRNQPNKATRERAFAAGIILGYQKARVQQLLDAAEIAYAKFSKMKPFWR